MVGKVKLVQFGGILGGNNKVKPHDALPQGRSRLLGIPAYWTGAGILGVFDACY
jgi:hypothetical protein